MAKEAARERGERLLKARLRYGSELRPPRSVSQEAVGELLGVTGVTVGRWESGSKEPSLATLERLADLYRVRAEWLAFGRGAMLEEEDETRRAGRAIEKLSTPGAGPPTNEETLAKLRLLEERERNARDGTTKGSGKKGA
jgi:transcriptional regulator with XRE-family HTH domain